MAGRRCTSAVTLFFFCFFFSISLWGADNPQVRYLGIEQGLSNNAVTSVYQDAKGFMWFGTYDGLNRYDGYGFTIYRNVIGDSNSIAFNNLTSIAGDDRHNLWIGGQKGVNIFDPVTAVFSSPLYLSCDGRGWVKANENTHIIKVVEGNYVLAGTHGHGLLVFGAKERKGYQVALEDAGGGGVGATGDRGGGGSVADYDIPTIEYDPVRKVVWVFIRTRGLYTYSLVGRKLSLVDNSLRQANCLRVDRMGRLWVGTDNGLFLFDRGYSENWMPQKTKVVELCADRKNELWIASDGVGVWRLPDGVNKALRLSSPISSNVVYPIYEDVDGRKWVGTLRGGINVIEPKSTSFGTVTYETPGENNRVSNFILSFCEDAAQNVWIGTDGAGLRYWNRKNSSVTQYLNKPGDEHSISSNFITCMIRTRKNVLWVSTWFGGVNRWDPDKRSFERYTCMNAAGVEEKNVWQLCEDSQQRLWASATNDGSLFLFNEAANKFEMCDEQISNLQSLVEDRKGELWGGNYSSLIHIDRVHKQHRVFPIGYSVRCIHEDRTGAFWVGTQEGGLLLFDRATGRYRRYTTAEGLPSNTVLRILEDKQGNLWMSTYNGLCRLKQPERTFRNFSPSDGLQSTQFSFNAAASLSTGEFLFGGIKGFNVFFPDSIYEVRENPNVYLTRVRVQNEPIEASSRFVTGRTEEQIEALTVPFSEAMVSLDFAALRYGGTDKLNYAYSLAGWDKGWNYSNGSRTANYSSLREGTYTFRIKVGQTDGSWGEETALLKLIVLPPWYRSWWAYLIYGLCAAGLVLVYLRYTRSKERLRYEVKLAHLETEKEKELIERKLSFFTHITHEFRTPLTLIINPVKELLAAGEGKERLHFVYRNAQRLLSLVDQLLLFRKAESGSDELKPMLLDLVELAREVYLCFVEGARMKKIDYRMVVEAKTIPLYIDREKVEIALYNLLSNALKYTLEGGEVVFSIEEGEREVRIVVADNGLGIPTVIGDQLFDKFYQIRRKETTSISGFGIGLYLVKQFVLAHKGKISYRSEPGKGTSFELLLPKGKEHLAGVTIYEEGVGGSPLFQEIVEEGGVQEEGADAREEMRAGGHGVAQLMSDRRSLLVVDDDPQLLAYICQLFDGQFVLYPARSGEEGIALAKEHRPDLIISDVHMGGISGIELCETVKNDPLLSQTPVILLTAAASAGSKLEGVRHGADDYITKPFDKELLIARVSALLESRSRLQRYFYDAITLNGDPAGNAVGNPARISEEDKRFLEWCIALVETNFGEDDFSIKKLSLAMGMSHSNLYQKVKDISGLSVNGFIRFIRLRKAAELFINTDCNVNEAALQVGINDVKYFREQFHKLFGINPSEYIKKYRKVFSGKYIIKL